MFKLRDYQEECVNNIINMNEQSRKIACLPTGSGKTILMSEICKRTNKRVLIIVQSSELRQQTIDKLKMVCGESVDVGSVQGNIREYNNRIIVGTRQTITSNSFDMSKLIEKGNFEYILIDECHCAVKQAETIINSIGKHSKVVGMTATPYNNDLKSVYNGFIYKRELIKMIEDKYLVDAICYTVRSNVNIDNVKTYQGDFAINELSKTINIESRNKLIYQSYIEKCKDRNKTLIFATDINHSKAIAEYFNEKGISCCSIDGTLKKSERTQILKDFEDGKIKVLVNVMILTIGLDIPAIDSIIFARATQSKALFIQMLGRGLRLSPETNKSDCLVIDIVDFTTKHNLVNCSSIFDVEDGESLVSAKNKKIVVKTKKKDVLEEDVEQGVSPIEAILNNIEYQETNLFNENNIDCDKNMKSKKKKETKNKGIKGLFKRLFNR